MTAPTAIGVFKELLLTRAITVVTASGGGVAVEGAPLDAVTVIQLDGDVVSYVREGAPLERHFAALRQLRALLRLSRACWLSVERGVLWGGSLGAQYFAHGWALDALYQGRTDWAALLAEPAHVLGSLAGFATPLALHTLRLLARAYAREWLTRRAESDGVDVLSARVRP